MPVRIKRLSAFLDIAADSEVFMFKEVKLTEENHRVIITTTQYMVDTILVGEEYQKLKKWLEGKNAVEVEDSMPLERVFSRGV